MTHRVSYHANGVVPLLALGQAARVEAETGCEDFGAKYRLIHSLTIENQCFSVRHKIELRYRIDSPGVAIFCDEVVMGCAAANTSRAVAITQAIQYWQGQQKTVVTVLCLVPKRQSPDFNLTIEVLTTALSSGGDTKPLPEFAGRVSLSTYCAIGEA